MEQLDYFVVDVFTDTALKGNPLGRGDEHRDLDDGADAGDRPRIQSL